MFQFLQSPLDESRPLSAVFTLGGGCNRKGNVKVGVQYHTEKSL